MSCFLKLIKKKKIKTKNTKKKKIIFKNQLQNKTLITYVCIGNTEFNYINII